MATFPNPLILAFAEYLMDDVILFAKGREAEYGHEMLKLVKSMDLSDNMIYGEIPEELTSLVGLQSLNLSKNLLAGRIPSNIGDMKWLESMDFSMNQFSGETPPSTASLTFLSHLNLSYNNLTGQIPKGTQLQSFDESCFIGNELCGAPLNKNCSANGVIPPPAVEQHRGYHLLEDGWFYLSLGLGFMFGFWGVLGSLLLNMPWSIAFSRFLNSMVVKLYGVIVEYI